MSADAIRSLSRWCRWQSGYIVCLCGAWNTRDAWHILNYKDRCYSCAKPLFESEQDIIYQLGKHLWDKAYAEYRATNAGNLNRDLMDLALELARIAKTHKIEVKA